MPPPAVSAAGAMMAAAAAAEAAPAPMAPAQEQKPKEDRHGKYKLTDERSGKRLGVFSSLLLFSYDKFRWTLQECSDRRESANVYLALNPIMQIRICVCC
jgi:hypothetical protein